MVARDGPDQPASERRAQGGTFVLDGPGGASIFLRIFPEEARLAEDARRAAEGLGDQASSLDELRAQLEKRLRAWYPRLAIRAREDLASLSQAEHVWYVLRDGRVHGPEPRLDRLHAAMATARDVKSDAARAIERARGTVAVAHERFMPGRRSGSGDAVGDDEDGDAEADD